MPIDFATYKIDTSDWFDSSQAGPIPATIVAELPPANDDYAYAAIRLFSWFPIVNSKGAAFDEGLLTKDALDTLIGKQINLKHDKSAVVGNIKKYMAHDDGVHVIAEIDREQALIQGLDLTKMRDGGYFSSASVEVTRDLDKGVFYIYDPNFNIVRKMPLADGEQAGVRRTTALDPFKFTAGDVNGLSVAEIIVPERFTGMGILPRPADKTAKVYALVADDETKDRLKAEILEELQPQITEQIKTETASAIQPANPILENHSRMDEKEIQKLQEDFAALKSAFTAKETAAAEAEEQVVKLRTELADKDAVIDSTKKELASAQETLLGSKIDKFMAELEGIHAFASDDERNAVLTQLKEKAGEIDTIVPGLKLVRENLALKAKNEQMSADFEAIKKANPHIVLTPVVKSETAGDEFQVTGQPTILTPQYADGLRLSDAELNKKLAYC